MRSNCDRILCLKEKRHCSLKSPPPRPTHAFVQLSLGSSQSAYYSPGVAARNAYGAGRVEAAASPDSPVKDAQAKANSPDGEVKRGADGKPLSEGEVRQVEQLEQRDEETRRHEEAHVSAGGDLVVSGPHYEFQQGPDGKQYAIGGEVQLDTAPAEDPDATILKMQRVRAAALAPAEPSAQDIRVASYASQQEMAAQREKREIESEGNNPTQPYDPVAARLQEARGDLPGAGESGSRARYAQAAAAYSTIGSAGPSAESIFGAIFAAVA